MENQDPAELAEAAKNTFKTRCALLVSALALVLTVNNLGGANTAKEATMNNILASNTYAFYQAKNVRQTEHKLAADQIEFQLAIVLTSVAIISNRRSMFSAASVLGVVGALCALNGYFLFY